MLLVKRVYRLNSKFIYFRPLYIYIEWSAMSVLSDIDSRFIVRFIIINLITLLLFIDINISIPFIIIDLIVNKYKINLMPLN